MEVNDKLNENIKNLTTSINNQISFKRSFLLSIVQGIGTAIGATLVAGTAIALLYRIITSFDSIPLIQHLIPPSYIESIIKSTKTP